jgi:Glycosyl transferase family 2.
MTFDKKTSRNEHFTPPDVDKLTRTQRGDPLSRTSPNFDSQTQNLKHLQLSVVVGCIDCASSIQESLRSLATACAGLDCEIILADASRDGTSDLARFTVPAVRIIPRPAGSLVPELWAWGIAGSSANVVALTTGNCAVTSGWANSMVEAIAAGGAAVGGPLHLGASVSISDAAVFFLRYSAFLSRASELLSDADPIAGDNSAYSRAALEIGGWNRERGFWETEVNSLLIAQGQPVRWIAGAGSVFIGGVRPRDFMKQRFTHGKLFGEWRILERRESRLRILLVAPLVPAVMLFRIAGSVWPHVEYRARLLTSLPFLAWFALCWAAGEAYGALRARR